FPGKLATFDNRLNTYSISACMAQSRTITDCASWHFHGFINYVLYGWFTLSASNCACHFMSIVNHWFDMAKYPTIICHGYQFRNNDGALVILFLACAQLVKSGWRFEHRRES